MTKYLVRLLLSFSILLSSGYSAIYANIDNDNAIDNLGSSFETVQGVNDSSQHPLSYSKSKEHGSDIFTVNNAKVEEEDKDAVKENNFLEHHFLSALHFSRIFGFLFQELTEDLHFSKFIPNTKSLRLHLVIQVFII